MKLNTAPFWLFFVIACFGAQAQPSILNGSFELDATPPYPGYGTISGWTPGDDLVDGYGLNEANGAFADNGAIPHGARVAFIQDNGSLNQTVSGFTVGAPYWLSYRENARGLCCGERFASLEVRVGGATVVANHVVPIVGESHPYRVVVSPAFIASETEMTLSFIKGGMGDSTALIDDVRIFTTNSIQLGIVMNMHGYPEILVQGIPDRTVFLEYKDSLAPGMWQLRTSFGLGNGSASFIDTNKPASGSRFYRAYQVP